MSKLWRFLKKGENNNDEFDIYSIMRSKIMKEYYRKYIKLSTEAKMLIILNSYISFDDQYAELNKLYSYCEYNDAYIKQLSEMLNLYTFLNNIINKPDVLFNNKKILYVLRENKYMCNKYSEIYNETYTFWLNEYTNGNDNIHIFDSLNEIFSYINENSTNDTMYYTKLYFINDSNKTIEVAELHIKFIDDKFVIHRVYLQKDLVPDQFKKPYHKYEIDRNERFYIPYNNGDSVTIKLPGINRNFTGILQKEFDGCEWYSFLEGYIEEDEYNKYKVSLDISRNCINSLTIYSIFDWIE